MYQTNDTSSCDKSYSGTLRRIRQAGGATVFLAAGPATVLAVNGQLFLIAGGQ